MTDPSHCDDCGKTLAPVRLIDRDGGNDLSSLGYAFVGVAAGQKIGSFPADGYVRSLACTGCGRLHLYLGAEPVDTASTEAIEEALKKLGPK